MKNKLKDTPYATIIKNKNRLQDFRLILLKNYEVLKIPRITSIEQFVNGLGDLTNPVSFSTILTSLMYVCVNKDFVYANLQQWLADEYNGEQIRIDSDVYIIWEAK